MDSNGSGQDPAARLSDHTMQPLDSIKGRNFIHYLIIITFYRTLNREVLMQNTVQKMYLLLSYGIHILCTWPVHNVFQNWPIKYYCQHKLVLLLLSLTSCFTKQYTLFQCQKREPNPDYILLDHVNYQTTQKQNGDQSSDE
jgi:hypothetical protein